MAGTEDNEQILRDKLGRLEQRIAALELENHILRTQLEHPNPQEEEQTGERKPNRVPQQEDLLQCGLTRGEVERYGRQLLLPEITVVGQRRLSQAAVLIVGAGGLGAPSALYLAAAGIGRLGLVDHDVVDLANLHRQIIHSEATLGMPKAISAKDTVERLNSLVECVVHQVLIDQTNALDIIKPYDVVLDCTDNVATRYLLNDACVLLKKPLISGSAIRVEGQLTIYNHNNGPCYRCLFPQPPPPETVTRCSDGGVLGPVPGVIGCLQALECVKLLLLGSSGAASPESSGTTPGGLLSGRMLLFSGWEATFRVVRLRPRNSACAVCGDSPSIISLIDYPSFCGSGPNDHADSRAIDILAADQHISCLQYKQILDQGQPHVLLDVRSDEEFAICSLPNSYHVPLKRLRGSQLESLKQLLVGSCENSDHTVPVYVVCRRGNDSQRAVAQLVQENGFSAGLVRNLRGGLSAWTASVDPTFPLY